MREFDYGLEPLGLHQNREVKFIELEDRATKRIAEW